MTKKMKKRLYRIAGSAGLFAVTLVGEHVIGLRNMEQGDNILLILYLLAYLVAGGDVIRKAIRNILNGQVFDENFLMGVATVGAFFVGEYEEAVAVMLFYQVGELFQSYAVNRSRRSIAQLMDIRPEYANKKQGNEIVQVPPQQVAVGDILLVKPGEKIPLDGVVVKGESDLDTKALTGESLPRETAPGDQVISGCINLTGVLEIRAEKEYGQSTVAKILKLVESQGDKKARTEQFITKFARYYTPAVVALAVLLAVIPPLVVPGASWGDWVYRALSFLVISCPCALVISIPLSFFGGLGGASRCGVLIKGSNYLESLAYSEIGVFDKTGTLTKGQFQVVEMLPEDCGEEELLETAAYCEAYSDHPIGKAVKSAWKEEPALSRISEMTELSGHGISALLDGEPVAAGNEKLMNSLGIQVKRPQTAGTVVYVMKKGRYLGCLVVADVIKDDARETLSLLKKLGVKKTVMLTGDAKAVGEAVAAEVGADQVYTELLPDEKVQKMDALMKEKGPKGRLFFVGDGINDAPVLAGADIGIAMGGMGSDAAIEAADVVIMTDEPSKIAAAIRIARKTLRIVWQNIVFAIGVKILVLILAALGLASMWAAVFADVGVAVIAICNAIRALNIH